MSWMRKFILLRNNLNAYVEIRKEKHNFIYFSVFVSDWHHNYGVVKFSLWEEEYFINVDKRSTNDHCLG